jgi:hypothetical protein
MANIVGTTGDDTRNGDVGGIAADDTSTGWRATTR